MTDLDYPLSQLPPAAAADSHQHPPEPISQTAAAHRLPSTSPQDPDNAASFSYAGTAPAAPRRKSHLHHHAPASESRHITRSRISYSCHTCRRRKVKCDKVHPACGNCVKTGAACVYDSRSLPHKRRPSDELQQRSRRRRDTHRDLRRLAGVPLAELLATHGGLPEEDERQEGGSGGGAQQKSGGSTGDIAARLDRLTSMVERLSKAPQSLEEEGDATAYDFGSGKLFVNSRGPGAGINGTPSASRLASRSSSPRRQQDRNSGNEDFPIPSGRETDLVDPVGTLNLGHLSLDDCGKSQYVGTTYWAYISDEIQELNDLLRHQHRTNEQPPSAQPSNVEEDEEPMAYGFSRFQETPEFWPTQEAAAQFYPEESQSPPSRQTPIRPEILDNIPTRRQSDILYKGFMSGVQAISPVTHPPTILKKYRMFWEWYDHGAYRGEPCPKPSFVPLLYAIWYGGSVSISLRTIHAEFNVETRPALSAPFHDQVTRWLKKISFPRNASLYGLAAFLLVQTILSKEEEPLTSSLFISMALRVAQSMGLHRDPAQFGIPPCEAEARRRVWWHIVHMDGVVAMSSGLPPQVSDENYWDVRMPSDVKDTLIGTPEGVEYERRASENISRPDVPDDPNVCGTSTVNVHYISAMGKYTMATAEAIRQILKIQLGTRPVTRKDMKDLRAILIDLTAKLRALVERIPVPKASALSSSGQTTYPTEVLDSTDGGPECREQYHTPILAAFHKWARILLSLFVHKAFCVAYQPFLKNARSEIWPAARQCALRHCHGFMAKFILLATDPDFQPFQWSWPGNHQPMHATMIMLIDLYERPTSPQAPRSRAFIDKIFSLSGPDGGVVGGEDGVSTARPLKDGGREAWDMMRRLREKAWQKAGLDPSRLWTEPSQAQVGVGAPPSQQGRPASGDQHRHYHHGSAGAGAGSAAAETFADGYYSLIKEPQTAAKVGQGQGQGQIPGTKVSAPSVESSSGADQKPSSMDTQPDVAAAAPPPLPSVMGGGEQLWPSPPPWLQTSSSLPGFTVPASPTKYQEIPDIVGSVLNGDDVTKKHGQTTNFPTAVNPNVVNGGGSGSILAGSVSSTQQPQQQRRQSLTLPVLPDTSTASTSSSPGTTNVPAPDVAAPVPDSAINFDWDQWDAVFGEYLPVVDGFMDIDPSPAAFDLPLQQPPPPPHHQQGASLGDWDVVVGDDEWAAAGVCGDSPDRKVGM